jgi:hypothetical protein
MFNPLEWPEYVLWIRNTDGRLTVIIADRLHELNAGAKPEDDVERRLVDDPDWLRVYLQHVLGVYPIEIHADAPLPPWDSEWLAAVE